MAIYRSNLQCPDLAPFFKFKEPPLQCMNHDVPSDPDFDPGCGFWTHDEVAILYSVARQVGGKWLDIGARLGWTASHIAAAEVNEVLCLDRQYSEANFLARAKENIREPLKLTKRKNGIYLRNQTAQEFLREEVGMIVVDGFVIDADHDRPQPTLDAIGCHRIAKPDAVILMHDFMGRPIQEAVCVLMALGWRCRIYDTPNGVALLWRGFAATDSLRSHKWTGCQQGGSPAEAGSYEWVRYCEFCGMEDTCEDPLPACPVSDRFIAPKHISDPAIDWAEIRERIARDEGFPYEKTE